MNIVQAIDKRKSRRTYCAEPIAQDKAALLRSRTEEYNLRSGLTIRFMERGGEAFFQALKSYGFFKGVSSLFVLKGPAQDPYLKEKAGYYGELLVLEATALGLGTCWVGGTYEASAVRKSAKEELVCVITVGAVPAEETFKERMIHKTLHRKSKSIEDLLDTDIEKELPAWLKTGMKAVQKAPSTRNTQKVAFSYREGILRASVPESGKFDLVDLGIAKIHFALAAGGRFEPGNNGRYIPPGKE